MGTLIICPYMYGEYLDKALAFAVVSLCKEKEINPDQIIKKIYNCQNYAEITAVFQDHFGSDVKIV